MKKVLIGLALVVASFGALAQETLFVVGDRDIVFRVGQTTYSNNNGPVALSWFKYVNVNDPRDVSYDLIQVHCPSNMYRIVQQSNYYGSTITSNWTNWNTNWNNPVPNSISNRLSNICKG